MKAYILKVEMIGLEPAVWRRVIILAGATFQRLHAGDPGHNKFSKRVFGLAVAFT
ncbi:plasmid pRiA4b ORF-3 family protein [Planococcus wigleyi]|uniref:plasmid pRiA4b ORF-3 family protein n=1 Tax=Planococcus wigleyi TaxID=2762216 RepID=UPI001CD8DE62|nr:plasmid pRiA4b ORF-3 family protein [Planococcus wigleyi]